MVEPTINTMIPPAFLLSSYQDLLANVENNFKNKILQQHQQQVAEQNEILENQRIQREQEKYNQIVNKLSMEEDEKDDLEYDKENVEYAQQQMLETQEET